MVLVFYWYSPVEAHYTVTSYNIQYIFSPEGCTSCHSSFLIYCVSCCWHLWNSVEPCRVVSISCFLSPLSCCITIICQRWARVKEMEHLKRLTLLSRYPSIFAECLHTSGIQMWLSWIILGSLKHLLHLRITAVLILYENDTILTTSMATYSYNSFTIPSMGAVMMLSYAGHNCVCTVVVLI